MPPAKVIHSHPQAHAHHSNCIKGFKYTHTYLDKAKFTEAVCSFLPGFDVNSVKT